MTREERRRALLQQAQTLRIPAVDELNKPLGGVRLDSLRVAPDQKLTDKLIQSGLATRFQRRTHLPRKDGRKLPTVIQLHADGQARAANPPRERAGRAPARPTVEELGALLERVAVIERELLAEKTRAIADRIAATKRRLVDLSGEDEAGAIRELHELTQARRSMIAGIRRDAFAKIENDPEFAPRRWLSLLSLDKSE